MALVTDQSILQEGREFHLSIMWTVLFAEQWLTVAEVT